MDRAVAPNNNPSIDLVVVVRNLDRTRLLALTDSVDPAAMSASTVKLILVDNGSDPPALQTLRAFADEHRDVTVVILSRTFDLPAACRAGIDAGSAPFRLAAGYDTVRDSMAPMVERRQTLTGCRPVAMVDVNETRETFLAGHTVAVVAAAAVVLIIVTVLLALTATALSALIAGCAALIALGLLIVAVYAVRLAGSMASTTAYTVRDVIDAPSSRQDTAPR